MADPLGSLEKIVKLALRIKEAVDTVRQNKEECQQIRTRAVRVSSLLSRLPETGMTADPAMCDALEDLEDSLRRAHTLVAACQESTTVCLYCTAGRQARRLRQVQDDISQKVMLVVFATNIQTTIVLTSIQTGQAGPLAEQAAGDVIATSVVVPCNLSADDARSDIRRVEATGKQGLVEVSRGDFRRAAMDNTSCWVVPTEIAQASGRWKCRTSLLDGNGSSKVVGSKSNNVPERSQSWPSAPCLAGGSSTGSSPDLASLWTAAWIELDATEMSGPAMRDVHVVQSASASCLRKLSLSELEAATHHFSVENMVGSGAYANVYKGVLQDGLVVAIKKFRNPYVPSAERIDELQVFSKFKHKNIVKLIGYRSEVLEDEKFGAKEDKEASFFLVEEYMPNGSLDKIINGLQLDWSSRFVLIQGIARGLQYLHKRNVVHLDVKPSNIVLDSDMNPKITDFGMTRVLNHNSVDIYSDIGTIAGTLRYMPPEYIVDGTLSKKHDVYGFGVTLLELISGMSRFKRASGQASIQWAWEARHVGGMVELLEPSLFDTPQLKEIERCVEVGLLCTQFDPADRPEMVDALEMLRGERALRTPVRPGYTKEPTSWFGGWSCLRVRF